MQEYNYTFHMGRSRMESYCSIMVSCQTYRSLMLPLRAPEAPTDETWLRSFHKESLDKQVDSAKIWDYSRSCPPPQSGPKWFGCKSSRLVILRMITCINSFHHHPIYELTIGIMILVWLLWIIRYCCFALRQMNKCNFHFRRLLFRFPTPLLRVLLFTLFISLLRFE